MLDRAGRLIGRTVGEQMEDARRAALRLPVLRTLSQRDGGFTLRRLGVNEVTSGDTERIEEHAAMLAAAGSRPLSAAVAVPSA